MQPFNYLIKKDNNMKCSNCGKQMSKVCDPKTKKCKWVCSCGNEKLA